MLAMEINLMPDWTVLVQLAIFLTALAVLYYFVFKPSLKCIDQRNKFTKDARANTEKLNNEADQKLSEREKRMSEAINEANFKKTQEISLKRKEAENILAKARNEAKLIIDSTETSVEISEKLVKQEMDKQADILSAEIVARIVDR